MQIVGLYRDPHGEKIFEDPIERTKSILDASYNAESDKTITMLKRKVTQLEKQLTESKVGLYLKHINCCNYSVVVLLQKSEEIVVMIVFICWQLRIIYVN